MADNVTLPGTGVDVAADDVGGALYQRVKIAVGADGAAADLAPGQATMAGSLPVAIASNQSAIPVTDNSGSLTVDSAQLPVALAAGGGLKVEGVSGGVAVSIGGAAADDAAAAGNPVPIGGIYQSTVNEVDANDVGHLRITPRRGLITAADYRILAISAATPVPSGSDLQAYNAGWGPVLNTDLEVRDTALHTISIPLACSGWRHLFVSIYTQTAFDQAMTMVIKGNSQDIAGAWSSLASFTIPASSIPFSIGSSGAVGQGGLAGGATAATGNFYSIPAMQNFAGITLNFSFSVAPTVGTFQLFVARST